MTTVRSEDVLRLSIALARLTRWLRRRTTHERANLGAGSMSALVTLAQHGPMRLGDLAARERVAPPTLSRIVAALEENGYAVRQPDPVDGRASLVSATAEGQQVTQGLKSLRAQSLHERMAQLPPDRLATLLAAVPILEELCEDD